jgi:hypothetical protein
MRLNSKIEIQGYLGKSGQNRAAWTRTRKVYGAALHYLPGSFRVWTTTDELDAIDRGRSLTLAEVLLAQGGAVGRRGGVDFALQRLTKRMFKGIQHGT